MSDWRGAMYIFRNEMRQSWIGVVITVLFFIYVGLIITPNINEMIMDKGEDLSWIGDSLYLLLVPFMGFLMNRTIFRYRTDDPFTRKITYFRTLPISLNAIVLARMIQSIAVSVPVAVFFYTFQYIISDELNTLLSVDQYMYFVFFWFGYSIIGGCIYVYIEQAYNGKIYFISSLLAMLLYTVIAILLWANQTEFLLWSLHAAKNEELAWPILANVSAIAALLLTGILIRRRLASRDFSQ
ncbi:hypothetical protein K0T92_19410 [Paenibacillus oenotherae]|uniref:ABC transporter permease n=1 Tax=Paenibacillus oenotherae TaxID=1435645 RepID=A0ABS7DAS4_9BACL|nr:hypothetical protein [Paenibacillus oenotherae]MBW7476889.1 hypothetical protein [Paenibacillus oenotherae]